MLPRVGGWEDHAIREGGAGRSRPTPAQADTPSDADAVAAAELVAGEAAPFHLVGEFWRRAGLRIASVRELAPGVIQGASALDIAAMQVAIRSNPVWDQVRGDRPTHGRHRVGRDRNAASGSGANSF